MPTPLYAALSLAFAPLAVVSSPPHVRVAEKSESVVAVPFGGDLAADALATAVENAVPVASKERGLGSVRADSVRPIKEALTRCKDDGCRIANARRLGARYAILGNVDHGSLVLRLIDVDVGDAAGSKRVDGDPPAVLAQVPRAVDDLVDQIAPKATRVRTLAVERARKARAAGDLDAADIAFAAAIAAAPRDGDKQVVNLWLERARLFDAAERSREGQVWDAFAAAVGPGTPGFASLDDNDRLRVRGAVHDNLTARAEYNEDYAFSARALRLEEAARLRQKIGTLFPDEAPTQSLRAAADLAEAGLVDEAHGLLDKLAKDESVDENVRLQALAALHARS